mmetsp:Transcript_21362/g.63856  ORF Transcript_21362/g.63856 Transcript_21362/m.63856 type:complete len:223 (+) Transcript_21362:56-724(+)
MVASMASVTSAVEFKAGAGSDGGASSVTADISRKLAAKGPSWNSSCRPSSLTDEMSSSPSVTRPRQRGRNASKGSVTDPISPALPGKRAKAAPWSAHHEPAGFGEFRRSSKASGEASASSASYVTLMPLYDDRSTTAILRPRPAKPPPFVTIVPVARIVPSTYDTSMVDRPPITPSTRCDHLVQDSPPSSTRSSAAPSSTRSAAATCKTRQRSFIVGLQRGI